jgi:hypothetical protein
VAALFKRRYPCRWGVPVVGATSSPHTAYTTGPGVHEGGGLLYVKHHARVLTREGEGEREAMVV